MSTWNRLKLLRNEGRRGGCHVVSVNIFCSDDPILIVTLIKKF